MCSYLTIVCFGVNENVLAMMKKIFFMNLFALRVSWSLLVSAVMMIIDKIWDNISSMNSRSNNHMCKHFSTDIRESMFVHSWGCGRTCGHEEVRGSM